MTPAYFDTSVLVKNYVREPGSARAGQLLRSHAFLSSCIVSVELVSALMRRKSRQELALRRIYRRFWLASTMIAGIGSYWKSAPLY